MWLALKSLSGFGGVQRERNFHHIPLKIKAFSQDFVSVVYCQPSVSHQRP
jgi:hypothetical protein